MALPLFYRQTGENGLAGGAGRTACDIAIALALASVVIAIAAHAPTDNYAYAQHRQMGAVIGSLTSGNWLLPRNQEGGYARKGQMYAWLCGPVVWATGAYEDFVFRSPTVAASLATGVLVYLLGRRWYGRRTGLLAACLWAAMLHMVKLAYVGTTDMLLTLWITLSIFCADRLLFHPAPRGKRLPWVVALWASMIFGVLTKGWGVASIPLVGAMIALAAALGPGFKTIKLATGTRGKLGLTARLVARRWWKAIRATHLFVGLAAVAAVLVPLWLYMLQAGGERLRWVVYFEVWQRATGEGEGAPAPSTVPPVLYLIYYTLPASVLAIGAMFLARPRRWFSRKGPLCLPLCWLLGVLIPYSSVHGFRPDYLLPCYAAVALMGAWAVEEVCRRGRAGGGTVRALRHVFAATPVLLGGFLVVVGLAYLFQGRMPKSMQKVLAIPQAIRPESWWLLGGAVILGGVAAAMGVWASMRWRLRTVAWAAIVAMPGVALVSSHFLSRHARDGDGERMLQFARHVRRIIGADSFAVFRMERLVTEPYLGRFGRRLALPGEDANQTGAIEVRQFLSDPNVSTARWLLTCDRGLIEMGAARQDENGEFALKSNDPGTRYRLLPGDLGQAGHVGGPVKSQRWGRMYLIELRPRPIRVSGTPTDTGYVPSYPED
jgi:4-amino-4-deoxy-L-arabinose transferase-like glycosyltransferase